ncbi:MAG: FAD-dependent oxidoreductase [Cyclobacteriaceae bacterium]
MTKVDFLLVGQGLAGSALGYELMKAGCRIGIINQSKEETASKAAAGLYNPITGRKMLKTWQADTIFPQIEPFYRELEQVSNTRFLHPLPIYRPFLSNAERTEWSSKTAGSAYEPYIARLHQHSHYSDFIHDPLGGIELRQSGYVDLPSFLSGMQQYFQDRHVYHEGFFDVTQVQLGKSSVSYGEITARQLIFCDGAEGYRNSFFHWLPYQPVKGEMLLIDIEKKSNIVFNRGVFVMPFGAMYKVGSTYDQQDLSFSPTPKGRAMLQEKLDKLLTVPYRVIDHWAGVRPATRDRRPFLGLHPYHQTLGIFNGLGTKGVSLTPYLAHQFVQHLLENKSLNEEVDIRRFERFYHAIS